jgi:hypothetical protein
MLSREICEKCRIEKFYTGDPGKVKVDIHFSYWSCSLPNKNTVNYDDNPPAGCYKAFEHAIYEGMRHAQ